MLAEREAERDTLCSFPNPFPVYLYLFLLLRPPAILATTGGDDGNDTREDADGVSAGGGNLAVRVATGFGLYTLALLTCVGNGMVIQAIRTEKRLRKVRLICHCHLLYLITFTSGPSGSIPILGDSSSRVQHD